MEKKGVGDEGEKEKKKEKLDEKNHAVAVLRGDKLLS